MPLSNLQSYSFFRNNTGLFFVLCLALSLFSPTGVGAQDDPGVRDTLRIGSVEGFRGGRVNVPILMYNDELLGAVTLVFRYDPEFFSVDNFLFDAGRLEIFSTRIINNDSVAGILHIGAFGVDLLDSGSGLAGILQLSIAQSTPTGEYVIDTASIILGPAAKQESSFNPSGGGPTIFPHFEAGIITVPERPATTDSLSIGSVTGGPGQQVVVEIVLANETPLVAIDLPFTYSSANLMFDSVIFAGTRGILATFKGAQHNLDSQQVWISLGYFDTRQKTILCCFGRRSNSVG